MSKDSDDVHNAVLTDYELERGEHPVGRLVHISTVTHAWRGHLAAVSPSYYILDPTKPVAMVDSTGGIGEYLSSPTQVREGDAFNPHPKKKDQSPTIRIPRAAVAWLVSW